jgi:hypothetical protein
VGSGAAPGNVAVGGAHPGRRSIVRWCKRLRAVVFNGGRGAPVACGDEGVALQLGGGREG